MTIQWHPVHALLTCERAATPRHCHLHGACSVNDSRARVMFRWFASMASLPLPGSCSNWIHSIRSQVISNLQHGHSRILHRIFEKCQFSHPFWRLQINLSLPATEIDNSPGLAVCLRPVAGQGGQLTAHSLTHSVSRVSVGTYSLSIPFQ